MKAKVSVIVPVYNSETTLERCVKSIIQNQYEELEILLIEDCSRDQSWSLCKMLSLQYPQVYAFHNENNRGVSYTRNKGLEVASGKYLLFVDSDDWVEKDYIFTMVNLLEENKLDIVISGYVNHDEMHSGRRDVFCWDESVDENIVDNCSLYLQRIYDKRILQQLWNKIFSLDIIRENNLRFDEKINVGEDFRFVLKYIKSGKVERALFLNRPIYHYIRDNSESLMSKVGAERLEDALTNMRCMYQLMGKTEEEISTIICEERKKQAAVYAYIIMHNPNLSMKQKKIQIQRLGIKEDLKLYVEQRNIYYKEKIVSLWKRLR